MDINPFDIVEVAMNGESAILGLDIGSVSISAAILTLKGDILQTEYLAHHGDIKQGIDTILSNFGFEHFGGIAVTNSTPAGVIADRRYDNQITLIEGARHFHENMGCILNVGGEKFGLIEFDALGNYKSYKTNTSCAAGTGSFLDQQAGRLNLKDITELAAIAIANKGILPKIATRCAVFAKTDLIHAQQEGHTLEEICDGLCQGLAQNIIDTVFTGEQINSPIIFCGGVAKNKAVTKHMEKQLGTGLIVDRYGHIYEAIGCALHLIKEYNYLKVFHGPSNGKAGFIETTRKSLFYPPLELKSSDYPDFRGREKFEYKSVRNKFNQIVEVDIYEKLDPGFRYDAYIGVDIGSTSTKAVLMSGQGIVLAGFYTRTSGRPVDAFCVLLEAINDIIVNRELRVTILGAATTGSGRKFVGKLIGADMVLDEITAHARAAFELNPKVDTIIEIGGQDSKFTTLKDGSVTFSCMNTVCAAGTGSFIEEQAKKLGCSLEDYASRAENELSPLCSERCTVFMERDINHYLNSGCTVDQVLAAALHSVRENYLQKVAVVSSIGDTIFFQGATAKNKALVAAFEQGLNKPILVSKYCHLTGALGAALSLVDEGVKKTGFLGLNLFREKIPIRSEICGLCNNHCKLTLAEIKGELVAYGFLCGRDYDTKKRVNNNVSGFDLLKRREKAFSLVSNPAVKPQRKDITMGLPSGLYLFEAIPFWRNFFHLLGYKTMVSGQNRKFIKEGKKLAKSEFCAPVTAMHGHIDHLLKNTDYVFLPSYIEEKQKTREVRRQFCYYSQFMPALVSFLDPEEKARILNPVVHYLYTSFYTKIQIYKALRPLDESLSFFEVSAAFDQAGAMEKQSYAKLKQIYLDERKNTDDINIALLGRPYSVLSRAMNKGIPALFGTLGVKTFFQDMVPNDPKASASIEPLLKEVQWNYGAKILESAQVVARTPGLYPVLITSFKCTPDSFIMEYFKTIMAAHQKPYLILELDEHDSSVGYETRIEAAVRSFRNNFGLGKKKKKPDMKRILPSRIKDLAGKTLVMPNWDPITCSLLAAVTRREGIETILMEETGASIRKSLRFNSGQCLPLNSITQGFVDCIEQQGLDPANTALWMSAANTCSLHLYPHHITTLLSQYGGGMEKAGVYVGEISFVDISLRAAANAYFAFMFGGLLRKMGCMIRPYEVEKGQTDMAMEKSIQVFTNAFLGRLSKEDAVVKVVSLFRGIKTQQEKRPKVAVFGDIYVRDNPVMNQDLVKFIEKNGGEVITTPYLSHAKMVAGPYFRKWFHERLYLSILSCKAMLIALRAQESKYYEHFRKVLREPEVEYNDDPEKILEPYNIKLENTGESLENILKVHYIKKHHPEVAFFVQASPSFCCASIVTESMADQIERITGVPVVSITYDWAGGLKNDAIIPYLTYPRSDWEMGKKNTSVIYKI